MEWLSEMLSDECLVERENGNDDKSSRCEGKNGTFGTHSNTWPAHPLDVIIGLTQAFSRGRSLWFTQ